MSTNNYNSKIDEPFPLTENTDYFNTLKKVNIIEESFCSGILDSYKIIALYGNWGSGKSSVIKTLMEHMDEGYHEGVVKYYNTTKSKDNNKLKKAWEISKTVCKKFQNTKEKFIPIKFDAWDYENEENIAYALLNKIFEELEKDADVKLELKLLKMKF
jgi:predicted KAP-like P-loop ATPase